MKKIKEWLQNKDYQKWTPWIEYAAGVYVIWAAIMYVALWFDLGTKEPAYTVGGGMMLVGAFFFFVPFVLGFLLGKVYNKGE